jgi:quercetin dioxygenase-like cupin family protein
MRADKPSEETVVLPAPPTSKGTAERFTGDVWVDGITDGAGPGTPTLATVRFAPGARTAWHCHSNGQTLHATNGHGLIGTPDGRTIPIRAGDTVYTPPDVWHWHGAAPDSFMSHLALSSAGGDVEWGEHVSDDEYVAACGTPAATISSPQ